MVANGGRGRIAPLDGLRGCAILLVIAGHSWLPQNQSLGAGGVTLFFVLSGYLITTILLRRDGSEPSGPGLRTFYARRARRLIPALVVLLAFETVLRLTTGQGLLPVVLAAGYVTNVALSFGISSTLNHTWSLAMEEQFYLLWPLALPLLLRLRRSVTVVVGLAVVSAVARTAVYFGAPSAWTFAYFSPFTRADAILAGCALALALRSGRRLPGGRLGAGLTAGALLALSAPFVWGSGPASVVLMPVLVVASSVMVARLAHGGESALDRAFSVAPLRWTGRISYGMYLWHPLALASAVAIGAPRFVTTVLLAAAVASVSWFVVERPFLRSRPSPRTARPAPTSVDMPTHLVRSPAVDRSQAVLDS